jgi:hypothetical protein
MRGYDRPDPAEMAAALHEQLAEDAQVDAEDIDPDACVDGFGLVWPEHDWTPGDTECRRCQADLSQWNDPDDAE